MNGEQNDLIDQYKECLRMLKKGECWCEASGSPLSVSHSKGCLFAQRLTLLEKQKDKHGKE